MDTWLLNKSDRPTWAPISVLLLQAEEDDSSAVPHIPESTESESGILSIINISRYSHIHRVLAATACLEMHSQSSPAPEPKLFGPLTSVELSKSRRSRV